MNTYEAMFLLDPGAASTWEAAEAEVRRLLDRAAAKVLGLKRWDERKLTYEIARRKRGVYALAFFEAPGEKIRELEHDAKLSEAVLRLLVLRHESLTPETIEKWMNAAPPPRAPERSADAWSSSPPRFAGGRGRQRDEHPPGGPAGAAQAPPREAPPTAREVPVDESES